MDINNRSNHEINQEIDMQIRISTAKHNFPILSDLYFEYKKTLVDSINELNNIKNNNFENTSEDENTNLVDMLMKSIDIAIINGVNNSREYMEADIERGIPLAELAKIPESNSPYTVMELINLEKNINVTNNELNDVVAHKNFIDQRYFNKIMMIEANETISFADMNIDQIPKNIITLFEDIYNKQNSFELKLYEWQVSTTELRSQRLLIKSDALMSIYSERSGDNEKYRQFSQSVSNDLAHYNDTEDYISQLPELEKRVKFIEEISEDNYSAELDAEKVAKQNLIHLIQETVYNLSNITIINQNNFADHNEILKNQISGFSVDQMSYISKGEHSMDLSKPAISCFEPARSTGAIILSSII